MSAESPAMSKGKPDKGHGQTPMTSLRDLILRLLAALGRFNKPHFEYRIEVGTKTTEDKPMLEITITNEQKVKVTINPVTATGKPATLDGVPTWTVTSGASTIVVAPDGMSADLISSDAAGDTEYLVTADVDMTEAVENITDTIKLTVESAKAASLGLVAGTPEAK